MRLLIIILLSTILSNCSSYNSKFICKEAMGSPCKMMSELDKKIDISYSKICPK